MIDFEEFYSVDNNLNGKHKAVILISAKQVIGSYCKGSDDYNATLDNMLTKLSLKNEDVVKVLLYSENNRRLALFVFPKMITMSQFGLVQKFCLEESEVFNNASQFFGQTIVYYKAPNGNNIPCDRLGNVITHAKGLVSAKKPTNSDEIVIDNDKHI